MTLEFKVTDGCGTLVPTNDSAYTKQVDQLSKLIEELNTEPKIEEAIKEVEKILSKDPLFVRGWDLLGELFEESGDEDQALQAYLKGYQAVSKILPADFNGPMDIANEEVQCFLRFHNAYLDSLLAGKNYTGALVALQRQLAMDLHDMFELKGNLGELNILAGNLDVAEDILSQQAEANPAAYFSLGYAAFKRQKYAQAVTYLRKAFIMAPYVGMFLSGQPAIPNIFWDNGPKAPSYTNDIHYVGMLGGELWSDDELEHAFIYWVSQTSLILMEKATMVGLAEQCYGKPSDAVTKDITAKIEALLAGITDETSAVLVGELMDPVTDEKTTPWQIFLNHHHRLAAEEYEGEECCGEEDCGCGSC